MEYKSNAQKLYEAMKRAHDEYTRLPAWLKRALALTPTPMDRSVRPGE